MRAHELEASASAKPHRLQPVEDRQAKEHTPTPPRDLLAHLISQTGGVSSPSTHAALLNRATGLQASRASCSLLQLQRQYGNRYVQRVLALSRQAEGDEEAPPGVEEAIQRARGGGQALDSGARAQMESAFGIDFSGVRVHTGAKADTLNRALNARAFTIGQNIFFRQGEYKLGSSSGRELLAHELTHVVQQTGLTQPKVVIGQPGDIYEQEADRVAHAVMQREQPVEHRPADTLTRTVGSTLPLPTISRANVAPLQRSIGSPAGGCGVCYGSPRNAGIAAHQLIQEQAEIEYPFMISEFQFFNPADEENGRLDLVLPTPRGLIIGEIKPANPDGYARGEDDLRFYERQIRSLYGLGNPRYMVSRMDLLLAIETVFPNGLPGCPVQIITLLPPQNGVYGYTCEPDFKELRRLPGCDCRSRRKQVPVPGIEPLPEPTRRQVLEEIRDFLRRVLESGEDAGRAADRFLREHPEVLQYLAAALAVAAIMIVVATIVEDIVTLGAGILDDAASFAAAWALVRAAQNMAR